MKDFDPKCLNNECKVMILIGLVILAGFLVFA